MKSILRFLRGPFKNALKVAMEAALQEDELSQERGWKLFVMLPRMLLHRPPRGGNIAREKLISRFELFTRGEWSSLLEASQTCDERAVVARRRVRGVGDNTERRAERATRFGSFGRIVICPTSPRRSSIGTRKSGNSPRVDGCQKEASPTQRTVATHRVEV